jgi:hypothetical protein
MAIVLTAMIDHLIGMRTARLLSGQKGVGHLSYEKLHDALSIHHQAAKRREDILRFTPFMKQVERDKRRKKIPGQHKGFRLRLTRMGSYRTPVLTAASPPVWVKAIFKPKKKKILTSRGSRSMAKRKPFSSSLLARSVSEANLYDGGKWKVRTR